MTETTVMGRYRRLLNEYSELELTDEFCKVLYWVAKDESRYLAWLQELETTQRV